MELLQIISNMVMAMVIGFLVLVFDYGRRIDDEEVMFGVGVMIVVVFIIFFLGRLS